MRIAIITALSFCALGTCQAELVNGDFSQGLTGWDYGIDPGTEPFVSGKAVNDVVNGRGSIDYHCASFAGWNPRFSGAAPFNPYLSQTISLHAGDIIQFDAHWVLSPNGGYAQALVWLYGVSNRLLDSSFSKLAEHLNSVEGSAQGSIAIKVDGTYRLVASALAGGEILGSPGYGSPFTANGTADAHLDIGNLRVVPVPEPSTLAIGLLGCAVLGQVARRRRHAKR